MLKDIVNLWPLAWPFNHRVKIDGLESCIRLARAEEWHIYAIRKRHMRPHVCLACAWLAKNLARDARIFETGCGSGINLLWLGKKGFRNIYGADLSPAAVCLGRILADKLALPLEIWRDDSLAPKKMPDNIDGLISLNWLYHLPGANLGEFFAIYKNYLSPGASVVFDMVDKIYDSRKNNQYHTDDFVLPKERRRKTEYPLRLSRSEIIGIVEKHGFRVAHCARVWGAVPRTVWLVENNNANKRF